MEECTTKEANDFAIFITYLTQLLYHGINPDTEQYLISKLDNIIDFGLHMRYTACFETIHIASRLNKKLMLR